ncbi:Protein gts1 [Exophiala xenobiotica]|nr:Protein gts1 [Exophiala xenobiotica]KAK5226445.1 Protein gts1 [Exophiala xenobiotica]KAK5253905.1 Protein gts1 [Exophiala xenobiotica]KAK5284487.1 Protein gts1 [Exophiala xenobiotica]KAK5330376.1 Protein gts1 [Exophiala xenobiotica]
MASMSKRTQARNEKELHDLLRTPGNSQCADCGAKNPAWASWNLGVFLCMRCASLHRKLGTHISKVKSLSMDTWTAEQVESMKHSGNNAVNKVYNPRNRKPDMPLDADEVDSAMERFIRKKYQEKSLADGRPEPPRRDTNPSTTYSRPQQEDSPPPPLPPKKGKLFGFSLRTSASALPLSRSDKKKAAKERSMDSQFHVPADDHNSMSRMADSHFDMTDADLQKKLNMLLDMGFSDVERNTNLLRRLNGNVERTIATLVQLGPSESNKSSTTRRQQDNTPSTEFPPVTAAPKSSEPSYNPFIKTSNQATIGLSMGQPQAAPAQQYASNNPFGQPSRTQNDAGLEQSFQSMQISQPLFPHSTGGYPAQHAPFQDPRLQYSMTPPVPSTNFQQSYMASPAAMPTNTNPFFQSAPIPSQSTGNNPFLPQTQPAAVPSSPSTNPFLGFQQGQPTQSPLRQSSLPATMNPFGIPPPQFPRQASQQQAVNGSASQTPDFFGAGQANSFGNQNNPFQTQQMQQQSQQQMPQSPASQTTTGYANFQYAQPQIQQQPQQPQMPHYQQQQPTYQQQQQQFGQQQSQPLVPQQTGRHDKNSIMALFNYPQLAPQQLAPIPEPADLQQNQQQVVSPAPSMDMFGQPNSPTPTKRSATMPVLSSNMSNMHSAGGAGQSRNPFLTNVNAASTNANANATFGIGVGVNSPPHTNAMQMQLQSPQQQGIAARHASRDSMLLSGLESGRHSPDAFANLSARYQ